MSELKELLPCPFCGGKAILHDYESKHWYVGCGRCFVDTPEYKKFNGDGDAVKAWNTRSYPPEVVELARDTLIALEHWDEVGTDYIHRRLFRKTATALSKLILGDKG